jgi:hypothetical protein
VLRLRLGRLERARQDRDLHVAQLLKRPERNRVTRDRCYDFKGI